MPVIVAIARLVAIRVRLERVDGQPHTVGAVRPRAALAFRVDAEEPGWLDLPGPLPVEHAGDRLALDVDLELGVVVAPQALPAKIAVDDVGHRMLRRAWAIRS
jgi:hypothetical protein